MGTIAVVLGLGVWAYFVSIFTSVFEFTWAHMYTGSALCLASIVISGLLVVKRKQIREIVFYLGIFLNISYVVIYPTFIYLSMYAAV